MDLIWAEDYEIGLIGTWCVIGFCLTSYLWMQTPDIFGRKPVILVSWFLSTLFPLLILFNTNLYLLYFYIFMFGFSTLIRGTTSYVYMLEMIPKTSEKDFLFWLTTLEQGFGLIIPISFYLTRDWRYLMFIYITISTYAWVHMWWMPESPKFYYGKRKFDKCRMVMNKISMVNTSRPFESKFQPEE